MRVVGKRVTHFIGITLRLWYGERARESSEKLRARALVHFTRLAIPVHKHWPITESPVDSDIFYYRPGLHQYQCYEYH